MSFSYAWNLVKMGSFQHPEGWSDEDVFCCGITASQAAEQSWNFCPFCGTKVPEEIVANFDTVMTGHPEVEGDS